MRKFTSFPQIRSESGISDVRRWTFESTRLYVQIEGATVAQNQRWPRAGEGGIRRPLCDANGAVDGRQRADNATQT